MCPINDKVSGIKMFKNEKNVNIGVECKYLPQFFSLSVLIKFKWRHQFSTSLKEVPQKNGMHKFEEPINGRWVESAMSITSSEKTSDSHDSILKEDDKPEEILIRWDEMEKKHNYYNENNDVTDSNGHHYEKPDYRTEREPENGHESKTEEFGYHKNGSMTNGIKGNRNDIFLPLDEDNIVIEDSKVSFNKPTIEVDSPTSSNGPTLVEEEPLVAVKRKPPVESIRQELLKVFYFPPHKFIRVWGRKIIICVAFFSKFCQISTISILVAFSVRCYLMAITMAQLVVHPPIKQKMMGSNLAFAWPFENAEDIPVLSRRLVIIQISTNDTKRAKYQAPAMHENFSAFNWLTITIDAHLKTSPS